LNWSFATGGRVVSSAAVVGSAAYFGSWDGYEYAVNVSNGHLLWKTYLGVDSLDSSCNKYGISSAPTVENGWLYVGGNNATGGQNATWYALNSTTGVIDWSFSIGSMSEGYYNWASPLIYGGDAYIGVASACDQPMIPGGLVQVNLTSHHEVTIFHTTPFNHTTRQYELGASVWSSPSVDIASNVIFASTGDPPLNVSVAKEPYSEAILALNATNISRNAKGGIGLLAAWQVSAQQVVKDGDFGAGPTVLVGAGVHGQTLVVAGNKNGYEYALNATNLGSWKVRTHHLGTVWQLNTSTTVILLLTPASYGGGLVYFGTPAVKLAGVRANGSVWAVNPSTGKVVWEDSLLGEAIGAPLYSKGVLLVGAGDYLYAFNATTGHKLHLWMYSSSFVSAIAIGEGRVLEGNYDANMYALCVPSSTCRTAPQP
jgi:outer membrane protein assembly factor BamB